MMAGKSELNARKALDEMKLEIANELNIKVTLCREGWRHDD